MGMIGEGLEGERGKWYNYILIFNKYILEKELNRLLKLNNFYFLKGFVKNLKM